ncbi:recombinase family protein [Amycolatopsis sp., V23-08]|uniref:Recombinase family protein n=1 Tax=Amycolatopsis heterodermiae TaxID=3110235 RepID=A0ABU5RJI5_9PSEU|nr:recombinase family protein [Amycolatopsis sp., V23-08]MEA5366452.1 recombinase family protein [Amycolatopsis sp., V23-08]
MSNIARLQSLTAKLETEPRSATMPELPVLAYGYVRSNDRDTGYIKACAHLLEAWCTAAGWRLGVVFRDNGYDSISTARPGFAGFLDALRLPEAAFGLVIDHSHLSDDEDVAKQLVAEVRRTSAVLRVVADDLEDGKAAK